MAADPYGFPDSAPGVVDASAPTFAIWTGMGAALCAAMGPCTCYMSYLLALPLSLAAIWYGWRGYSSSDALARNASTAGLLGGLLSLMPSLTILLMIGMYLLVFVMAIVAAAFEN